MINKNEVVVYLENDGKLVRYDVSYDKDKIMSYINNKIEQLGEKCEKKNIFSSPFCVFNDKRCEFFDGNLNKCFLYSEEKSMIKDVLESLKIRKKCLDLFIIDRKIVLDYMYSRVLCDKNFKKFIEEKYIASLDFYKLIDWLGDENLDNFLNYFHFNKSYYFDYNNIQEGISDGFDYAEKFYIKCYGGLPSKVFINAKKEVLNYSKLEFEENIRLARENTKVLRL